MIPRVNSYFSGAGLMDIGLQRGGIELGQSFELDSACCNTARVNFSHEVVKCDLELKLVEDEKPCDVMAATYPCTKYTIAADIHGITDSAHWQVLREMPVDGSSQPN